MKALASFQPRLVRSARRLKALLRPSATQKFRGAYATFAEAVAAIPPGRLAGYDHEEVADIAVEDMCEVKPFDYPVLFWLKSVEQHLSVILDAGGHIGTKYRAFMPLLNWAGSKRWCIYELPTMAKRGADLAQQQGLSNLEFVTKLLDAPKADLLLASGLLQYLDIPFLTFVRTLPERPRYLLLNKVSTRDGPTLFTLENFGLAEVPYQQRNRASFEQDIASLGYRIVDQWVVPAFSHIIPGHEDLGPSTSRGYFAERI